MNDRSPPPLPADAGPVTWQPSAPEPGFHETGQIPQMVGHSVAPHAGPPPHFNPRQAALGAGQPRSDGGLVPPPAMTQGGVAAPQPRNFAPAASAPPYDGGMPAAYEGTAYAQADPAFPDHPASGYGYADPMGYGTQPYAPVPVEPAGGKESFLAKLTGRMKSETAPTPSTGARKPFLMGLLTGVVLMLILGQVFRASDRSPDYAAVPTTPAAENITASEEPETVAFLDRIEGLPD